MIPKAEIVKFVLKEVLQKQRVRSQARLAGIVRKKLRESDKEYAVSEHRVRIIAMRTPGVRVKIRTKKGRHPKRCPACSHTLRKTYTKNLRGRKVLVSMRCSRCSYRGSGDKWTPSMYEFELSG